MGAALHVEQRHGDGQVVVHAMRQLAEQDVLLALGGDGALHGKPQGFAENRERDADAKEYH